MIEDVAPSFFEKRLMQLGVFAYAGSVVSCGVAFLVWQSTKVFAWVLWAWAVVAALYGLRLIVVRVGWIPTRRGPKVCRGNVAVSIGIIYTLLGIGLGVIASVVPLTIGTVS